jgi:hypothetical protein
LIFEDEKEAADEIFDQVLSAKAYGQTDYTGPGEEGRDIDSNLSQGRQNSNKPDKPDDNRPQNAHQRPDSLRGRSRNNFRGSRGTDEERFQPVEPEAQ